MLKLYSTRASLGIAMAARFTDISLFTHFSTDGTYWTAVVWRVVQHLYFANQPSACLSRASPRFVACVTRVERRTDLIDYGRAACGCHVEEPASLATDHTDDGALCDPR